MSVLTICILLLGLLATASALAPGAAPLRAPAAARLRAQRLGPVRACDDAVDDDAAEEGADPFELPVMKMKRLVTPAQAGYERMRERQKQRRDAANGAPTPPPPTRASRRRSPSTTATSPTASCSREGAP